MFTLDSENIMNLNWKRIKIKTFDKFKYVIARKFYIRRNNNKVDSIETWRILVADFRPGIDLEKCM